MELHDIELPRRIMIGSSALEKTGPIARDMGLTGPALLLSNDKTMQVAGEAVMKSLLAAGIAVTSEPVGKLNIDRAEQLAKRARDFAFVIGVGGGMVIDAAKYAGFKAGTPFISVPTAPSHDGIASGRVTIFHNGQHHSFAAKPPLAIIADMGIIGLAPYKIVAAGCGDSVAKLTAIADWKLAADERGEQFSDYAAALALLAAEIVIKSASLIQARDPRGIENLVNSLVGSGLAMCIAGSSRPASGSEHLFSHALDGLVSDKKSLHGEQTGVGTILCAYMHGMPWQMVKDMLKSLGCPTTAAELGVPPDMIVKALVAAKTMRSDRYTILQKLDINEAMARRVATETGVI